MRSLRNSFSEAWFLAGQRDPVIEGKVLDQVKDADFAALVEGEGWKGERGECPLVLYTIVFLPARRSETLKA